MLDIYGLIKKSFFWIVKNWNGSHGWFWKECIKEKVKHKRKEVTLEHLIYWELPDPNAEELEKTCQTVDFVWTTKTFNLM